MKISLPGIRKGKASKKAVKGFDQAKWIRGFSIAAIVIWIFYSFVVDLLPYEVSSVFQKWMPATTVNEALVWVICALGLNIVVGYAGLLDLGFVAFWAIGGYVAGWLMSDFFQQVSIHLGSTAPAAQRGIHISFWGVLVIGGLVAAVFGVISGAPTLR